MIQAGDFRKGTTFEMDGDVWQIIDFQHVKPGKGAAFVRTKIRSVMTGSNRDMTFNPYTTMELYIISWTQNLMNNYQLIKLVLKKLFFI